MKTPDIIPRSTVWTDYIAEFLTLDGKSRQEHNMKAGLNEAVLKAVSKSFRIAE